MDPFRLTGGDARDEDSRAAIPHAAEDRAAGGTPSGHAPAVVIGMPSTHLLITGDRAALGWVLTEQRMAFPAGRSKAARALEAGDEVFLCTTRGCFRNPTRDLGRVIARAAVAGPVRGLDEPVVFGERSFTEGCRLEVSGLARLREGLALRDLVPRLSVFPDPATWSVRMRRASLTLPPGDADLVRRELAPLLRPYGETVGEYRWEPVSV